MAWVYLFIAGVFETIWAVAMKYADGFTKPLPSVLVAVAMVISVGLLGLAMKTIPLGTAYAIWTGIGTVCAVVYGILFFGEPAGLLRLVFISMIIAGLVGLKLVSTTP